MAVEGPGGKPGGIARTSPSERLHRSNLPRPAIAATTFDGCGPSANSMSSVVKNRQSGSESLIAAFFLQKDAQLGNCFVIFCSAGTFFDAD
jgi:hypothetical protein